MSAPVPHPSAPGAFSRRALLAAAGAVPLLVVVAGCSSADDAGADAVTPAQVDRLAGQVGVQEALVAACDALPADLAATSAVLAAQARDQLARLREAAPSVTSAAAPGTAVPTADPAADPRAALRALVAATADSHATACLDFTGARSALLGSIAAGLRGHDGQLA